MRFRRALASRLILRPSVHPIEAESLRRVEIERERGLLEAFVGQWHGDLGAHSGEPLDLLVLKLPGTAGRGERSTLFPAHLMAGRRGEVWTWNAPGYGRSTGPASLQSLPDASLEFYDHVVARRAGRHTQIWLSGNSLGCTVALHLATQRVVAGLVLRNPPPLVDLVAARDAWWNLGFGGRLVAGWIPPQLDAPRTAPRVERPAVFIESGADSLVTPAMQRAVRQAYAGPQRLLTLEGAEHDTPMDDRYYDQIRDHLEWLWGQGR
jgi:pimeloyl-ACP methyl ester carboxylesterase